MFTGIIESIGRLSNLKQIGPQQREMAIACQGLQADMKLGDSLAVDGVCLTITHFTGQEVRVEVSSETMQHSLFGDKKPGSPLNLERALRLGDRLGGHLVQGHVDGKTKLLEVKKEGNFYRLRFALPTGLGRYLVAKGSVALNGVSLTIASLDQTSFSLAIIPHTYQNTNLASLTPGDLVHLETDVLSRMVERLLTHREPEQEAPRLSAEFLQAHGFF